MAGSLLFRTSLTTTNFVTNKSTITTEAFVVIVDLKCWVHQNTYGNFDGALDLTMEG
ncbi:unnamed protein product [Acidithrix sp. C25]|nr:unnamed protein product [Acidithrix sp. C25]CAG4903108.1 unnamed protein product [Acidithrix sp. C25]CAG4912231.1 unnamed protein product [Acidithrix sp. C25]CAG4923710.1 unnamed protein product [Acidithrix sp. C25]CAG4929334.1 unnamed protein product [Acidithrix sp. C25]